MGDLRTLRIAGRVCGVTCVRLWAEIKNMKSMKTEHRFKTEDSAREVVKLLNAWGSRRNNGNTIALREGSRVVLRPEFTSRDSSWELAYLSDAFE